MQTSTFIQFLVVFLGGGIGASLRHLISSLSLFADERYYYTVIINVSGCMAMGVLTAIFQHFNVSQIWSLFLMVGLLGGYTTYSAFTLDAMELLQHGHFWISMFYMAITIIGGLGSAATGLFGTEKLLKIFC